MPGRCFGVVLLRWAHDVERFAIQRGHGEQGAKGLGDNLAYCRTPAGVCGALCIEVVCREVQFHCARRRSIRRCLPNK